MYLSRKRFSFAALVGDFYCMGIALGAINGLYVASTRRLVEVWWAILPLLILAVVLLVYHAKIARSVAWFTPGEIIFGRSMHDGAKWWTNPYDVSRAPIFILVFISLVTWGNMWDSASHEKFYLTLTLPIVLGRIAFLAVGLWGLILLGRGQPYGAYLVAGILGISLLSNLVSNNVVEVREGIRAGFLLAGISGILYPVGIGLYYSRHVAAKPNN